MIHKTRLYIMNSCAETTMDMASAALSIGHPFEIVGDISQFSTLPNDEGVIIARDRAEDGGIAALHERLRQAHIFWPIIATDAQPQPGNVVAAIKAGAADYLALPLDPKQLADRLTLIEERTKELLVVRRRVTQARQRLAGLTRREREVLERLAHGETNMVVAKHLNISPRTAEVHRANLLKKLGVCHVVLAVRLLLEADLDTISPFAPEAECWPKSVPFMAL